jgi:beta-glucosidase
MPAEEVAQLYVRRVDGQVSWPVKELKAFRRIALAAGETKTVTLEIPVSELRYWDETANDWALEHGTIELLLGSASDDIRQTVTVKI